MKFRRVTLCDEILEFSFPDVSLSKHSSRQPPHDPAVLSVPLLDRTGVTLAQFGA